MTARAAFAVVALLCAAVMPSRAADTDFFVGTWHTWREDKPLVDRCDDGTRFVAREDGTFDVIKLTPQGEMPPVHVRFVPQAGEERARLETLDKDGYSIGYLYVEFVDADTWRDGVMTYGRCKAGRPT